MTPKILLLSIDLDISTTNVMRWIRYLDHSVKVIRLHPIDICDAKIECYGIDTPILIKTAHTSFSTEEISLVWTRKWIKYIPRVISHDQDLLPNIPQISTNLQNEYNVFFNFLIYKIEQNSNTYWLNKPYSISPNKLQQLCIAKEIGLETPFSIITTQLKKSKYQRELITKLMSDGVNINLSGDIVSTPFLL